ncbi:alpha-2-macroglobulin [Pararobbsia alpina]|uniref:alpha-2-macroglobulin family protein n=1 Tax=Pararobbsia alpina TaxID=621374 RepID=UPI0039A689AD
MTRSVRWLAAVLIVIIAALAVFAVIHYRRGTATPEAEGGANPNAPFTLVDAANREYEGQPAIALTFSQPLSASGEYDKVIRVLKMPPAKVKAKGKDGANTASDDSAGNDSSGGSDAGSDTGNDTDSNAGENGNSSGNGQDGQPASAASEVSTSDAMTDLTGGTPVQGGWVVGDNPRLLYFPHVQPLTRYVVQVMDTVKAADGRTLGHETRYSISTPAVSPAYYFASRGMVLPAKQNGGLPVVTVNVPEVDVQFLRVRNDQLPRFLDAMLGRQQRSSGSGNGDDDSGDAGNQGDQGADSGSSDNGALQGGLHGAVSIWSLDQLHKMTDSVYHGRFLTEQQTDKRSVTFLPVEDIKPLKDPGIYIAIMSRPGRFGYEYQTTYFYVSDLGLHIRLFEQHAEAYVSSLTDGSAVSGVDLTWVDKRGRVLARGTTDGDGHTSFVSQPAGAAAILAQKDRQMSMLAVRGAALDLSEFDVTGLGYSPVRLFAWSGRDLYRPGETFDVSVLARDADGHPVPTQPIQATLRRADGKTQSVAMWAPDPAHRGYFQKTIALPADAPTGEWSLELRSDPASDEANTTLPLHVEEFLPERMKLELTNPVTSLKPRQPFTVSVKGTYLYGAPAAGNTIMGLAEFSRNKNPLEARYPGFEFGDANDDSLQTHQPFDDQTLDDDGRGSIEIPVDPASGTHSPVTVRATVSLLESGGRPVIRNIERTIWPAPVLTAVRPLFTGDYAPEDSPADFEIIRTDENGNLKPEAAMPYRLFLEERQYYWRFDDQRGWNSGYTENDQLAYTGSVSVPSTGRGHLRVPVKYGRYRLEITDPATGLTQIYRFYAGWSAQQDETAGMRPDRVALKLDHDGYRGGDTAHLTITPPHAGVALITVDGDRTLWSKRMKVDAANQVVDIPVDPAWQRHDLYVSVMVLRPGNEGDLVTPARALGVIALPLARADRKLDVNIEAPPKARSETLVHVKVKVPQLKGQAGQGNQSALLTLSAVDVGILNITQFPTPDPFGFFFGKLRYGADLHDIYGNLIEKMAGKKGKLKWGGDTTPKPTSEMPKKVKLVDLFNGPVQFDANGEADIPVALPDFNGTLRLSAVVAGADTFGSHSQDMIVAAPVIAELSTPRYLNFDDHSTIALDLQNLTGAAGDFSVEVHGDNGLTVQGGAPRTVTLKPQQKQTLRLDAIAGEIVGLHAIDVTVKGPNVSLTRHYALEVEAPTPTTPVVQRFTVEPGASLPIHDPTVAGLYPGSVTGHLVVSDRLPIDVRSAVKWLLEYPYGCAEQVTSSAYPWLYVDEAAARQYGLKPYTHDQRAQRIDFALGKLGGYQGANGGFSLWGSGDADLWLSAYVAGFLQDARTQGFGVPDSMYNRAMAYLLHAVQEGSGNIRPLPDHVTPADIPALIDNYAANNRNLEALVLASYVLARERKAPVGTLRQLFDQRGYANSGLPLVELGIALNLMGDQTRSQQAIKEGIAKQRIVGYWWWDYGSELRDATMEYVLLDREHMIAGDTATGLLGRIQNAMVSRAPWYYSTQDRLALFRLGQILGNREQKPWSATIAGNGASGGPSKTVDDKSSYVDVTADQIAQGVTIQNGSDQRLFVELALSGNPVQSPSMPPDKREQIKLTREYLKADGTALDGPLKVGDTVLVHLTAASANVVNSALVVDRVPAGLEVENENLVQGETGNGIKVGDVDVTEAMSSPRIKHVEFRDDRFAAAVQIGWSGSLNLFYRARVVTPGQFNVPPVFAQDMYRPQVFGILDPKSKMSVIDTRASAAASSGGASGASSGGAAAPAASAASGVQAASSAAPASPAPVVSSAASASSAAPASSGH